MKTAIPDKYLFKIGEIATFASLKPSVLRYWESEFTSLNPQKSRSGQRLYTRQDLDLILEIKKLLYGEKLTIEGARKRIDGRRKRIPEDDPGSVTNRLLIEVKEELRHLRDLLS